MENINKLTGQFKFLYDRFLIGCDAIEESNQWNKDELGEMDAFYSNDLISVIIRLIAADGNISEKEVEYLNDNFGFEYTVDELTEVYDSCREDIGHAFDESYANGITYMRSINSKLADAYKELLAISCEIIIESDGIISDLEIEEVTRLRRLVE